MTIDVEIYRTAYALIRDHGHEAFIHAATKAHEMLEAGDLEGQSVWMRVHAAIDDLLQPPTRGQSIH